MEVSLCMHAILPQHFEASSAYLTAKLDEFSRLAQLRAFRLMSARRHPLFYVNAKKLVLLHIIDSLLLSHC